MVRALLLGFVFGAHAAAPNLWPMPKEVDLSPNSALSLEQGFKFVQVSPKSALLDRAFGRYEHLLPRQRAQANDGGPQKVSLLNAVVEQAGEHVHPGMDESYTLTVAAPEATLHAVTVFGALRGLETFAQLCENLTAGTIRDAPNYKIRGLLIDTSRHWLPLNLLKANLDAMAYNKLNLMHWHIVDMQAFPWKGAAHPELAEEGAWSEGERYEAADVREVVEYANDRGIRVVMEFDTPGHVEIWNRAHPEYVTEDGLCLRVNRPELVPFVESILADLLRSAPDPFVHLGGDEVQWQCWTEDPEVSRHMNETGKTPKDLETKWENDMLQMAEKRLGKKTIVWQDVFDMGVEIPTTTVIDVWKNRENGSIRDELAAVTKAGFQALLSGGWYLDQPDGGLQFDAWQFYNNDPRGFDGTEEQKQLVIGGKAAMWGEHVDATNLISRVWPRACAAAERLWSWEFAQAPNPDLELRLPAQRCRMVKRGLAAEPVGPGHCEAEFDFQYSPPWSRGGAGAGPQAPVFV